MIKKNYMTRDASDKTVNIIAERLADIRAKGGLYREAKTGAVDMAARTVEISFSSEIEVERYWGIEVLSHDVGAVDMSRLTDGAAVLWMHNWNDQRGAVLTASIDADRVGRAKVKISRSPAGDQLLNDINDGIISKVSVGYSVNAMRLSEERADGSYVYLVTEWQPFELSFVSIPADATVGVGRAADKPHKETIPIAAQNPVIDSNTTRTQTDPGQKNMKEGFVYDAQGNLVRAKLDDNGKILEILEVIQKAGEAERAHAARGLEGERTRCRDLLTMGETYGEGVLAAQMVRDGKTAEDLQRVILGKLYDNRGKAAPIADQVLNGNIGLTDKEVRRFSLMTAVRALANPSNAAFQRAAAFEFEAGAAAAKLAGKESRGIMIPADVLARSFSTTTPAGGPGSNVIATELMASSFIDLLRNKTWAMGRATTIGGLVGNIDIPRQNGATQAYWLAEGADATESDPSLDQIELSPHTLAARTEITRRLMMQSTPDAELIVRNDLIKVMALAVDKAVLYATGVNQPTGLKSMVGLPSVTPFVGAFPTFAEYITMESELAEANADIGSMAYVINAKARGNAKSTLKFQAAGSATIWEGGGTDGTINGYPVAVTNQLTDGDFFFGNWSDLLIGMWSGLDMMVDPYSLSASGGIRIVCFQDLDINARHLASFAYGTKAAA